ncbi:unnamed protein product, partial [Rotaria sp. Silwood1]
IDNIDFDFKNVELAHSCWKLNLILILCLAWPVTQTNDTIIVNEFDGITLFKTLIPHENLRYIDITVETIDDLYVLLDGLVPNVEKMIIQLSQPCILSYIWPEILPSCLRLIEFTLLDSSVRLNIDNIKSILYFMPKFDQINIKYL